MCRLDKGDIIVSMLSADHLDLGLTYDTPSHSFEIHYAAIINLIHAPDTLYTLLFVVLDGHT